MGRPRAFDETEVARAAVRLFADRAYDGISVDDLVTHLGVHRNSLYKIFGSKRGLYLAALRWHLDRQVRPLLDRMRAAPDPARALRDALAAAHTDLDFLLLAAVERAPADAEVAAEVAGALRELDVAVDRVLGREQASDGAPSELAGALTAAMLGLRLRARAGAGTASAQGASAGAALFELISQSRH
jgi:TetR/AcrR family transcriptional repressor of nem operon